MELKWKIAFGLAVFNDLIDLTGIGAIPVLGDLLDIATSGLLWKTIGTRKTALMLLEFIPGLDFLPTYTVVVGWSYIQREKTGMRNVEVK